MCFVHSLLVWLDSERSEGEQAAPLSPQLGQITSSHLAFINEVETSVVQVPGAV